MIETYDYCYAPPTGAIIIIIPLYIGASPYAILYSPFGGSNALKGLYTIAQGLAPVCTETNKPPL